MQNRQFQKHIVIIVLYLSLFQIGASSKLSFAEPAKDVASVWKLDADDIAEDDLIDSDQLLSADDLKKPDPASLKGKNMF